jgi:hypothetical protein
MRPLVDWEPYRWTTKPHMQNITSLGQENPYAEL